MHVTVCVLALMPVRMWKPGVGVLPFSMAPTFLLIAFFTNLLEGQVQRSEGNFLESILSCLWGLGIELWWPGLAANSFTH